MPVLFVLLPTDAPIDALPASAGVAVRRYPRADDARHLASLVRAGRDPAATRWRRGALRAVLFGAGVGGCVNGLLAGCAGLFAGMLDLAIPLGLGVGAFLGGFTAAMTGTERPRDELLPLLRQVSPGTVLVQATAASRAELRPMVAAAERLGYAVRLAD